MLQGARVEPVQANGKDTAQHEGSRISKDIEDRVGEVSVADVLGPFGEAVAPVEALSEPVSDNPAPKVRFVNTIQCIDVVKQPHVRVDRKGLAPIGDEFPPLDLGQDTRDTSRIGGLCRVDTPRIMICEGDQEPSDVTEVALTDLHSNVLPEARWAACNVSVKLHRPRYTRFSRMSSFSFIAWMNMK
jgi:hypothetical protein